MLSLQMVLSRGPAGQRGLGKRGPRANFMRSHSLALHASGCTSTVAAVLLQPFRSIQAFQGQTLQSQ
jgi:hypothetical protein